MYISRRHFLIGTAIAFSGLAARLAQASTQTRTDNPVGNFRYIYGNAGTRAEFYDFLTNVFHLYPERELHTWIESVSRQYSDDREIYRHLQQNLPGIKPFLADLSYAVPALIKQKRVMAGQTSSLLSGARRFDGYLELGSHGRYLDALEEVLDIEGDTFFVSERAPTYSPVDIIDRGQISRVGQWIPLSDYRSRIATDIPAGSIGLATVYIGFHHCPPGLREEFIGSVRDTLRPDGYLVLRDHDAHNARMWRMVALAHDVFNMGTMENWEYNYRERRHFYPLTELNNMMQRFGFKPQGGRLRQDGDPTLNTLMLYRKA